MLAVAGLSTTAEAVDIATSAINAFNLKGEEADKVYDVFMKAVNYGKTDVSKFAQGFGAVAGVVASANIDLKEYSAAVAAMTGSGLQASIAHTQLKAAIAGLSRGSKEQIEIFNKLGSKSFKDLIKKAGGMVGAFERINKAVNGDESKLISLMGSVEAYNAVLTLTGARNEKFKEAFNDMANGSDMLKVAYEKQMGGLNMQMSELKNNLQNLSIKFGNGLLPIVKAAGQGIKNFTALLDKMPDGLTNFLSIAAAGTGVLTVFGGTAVMAASGIIKNLILLRNVLRGFSIAAWANPALFPIIGITAGIAALAAGAVFCYKKFEGFRSICLWSVLKAGGAWIALLARCFAQGAANAWEFIKPALKMAAAAANWVLQFSPAYKIIKLIIKAIGNLGKAIGDFIKKSGGFKGIGNSIKNFGDEQAQKADSISSELKRNQKTKNKEKNKTIQKADGSHAQGLDYVPFDGYIAQTHKGEAILNKSDADIRRNSEKFSSKNPKNTNYKKTSSNMQQVLSLEYKPSVTFQWSTSNQTKEEFTSLLKKHKDEILRLISETLSRQQARTYL